MKPCTPLTTFTRLVLIVLGLIQIAGRSPERSNNPKPHQASSELIAGVKEIPAYHQLTIEFANDSTSSVNKTSSLKTDISASKLRFSDDQIQDRDQSLGNGFEWLFGILLALKYFRTKPRRRKIEIDLEIFFEVLGIILAGLVWLFLISLLTIAMLGLPFIAVWITLATILLVWGSYYGILNLLRLHFNEEPTLFEPNFTENIYLVFLPLFSVVAPVFILLLLKLFLSISIGFGIALLTWFVLLILFLGTFVSIFLILLAIEFR